MLSSAIRVGVFPRDMLTEELEQCVLERKAVLEHLVPLVLELVREQGEIMKREVYFSHIMVEKELHDVGGFGFRTHFGQSKTGGNTLLVWHYPTGNKYDFTTVLKVEWQTGSFSVETCTVHSFDTDTAWQEALSDAILRRYQTLATMNESAQAELALHVGITKEAQETEQNRTLETEARRLGISF